ncbi:glycosyltransferase family 2 protein [Adhaeribacter radiodurans]|uniref:Glycosyltransferase family 2 protein n=1 Tax=Adhaeribacter radiodurans TaxID=2745197 RepID=A0A7L7L2Z0_9BACT|nr:glycosyltransferase family 2 protein [Adhaeribacter radiodurans]QMU26809.1 glycosyltransferase family 2 protein [Adhaeribacter radiodurans]
MSEPNTPFISVVSPVYGAAELVDLLVANISQVLRTLTSSYEIILVDDGSPDAGWSKIEQNAKRWPQVKGIKLSRNFGQHRAISAGLKFSTGQWVVVLDCDLQDNPLEIPQMLLKAREGYKIVLAQRNNKKHSRLKIFFSQVFNRVLTFLTNLPFDSRIGNFGLYHRDVITAICQKNDRAYYFPMMVQKVGFRSAILEIEHQKRPAGESSYSFGKNIKLAASVLFFNGYNPLQIDISVMLLTGILLVLVNLYAQNHFPIATTYTWGIFLLGSVFFLSIIGFNLFKTFGNKRNKPCYQIEKKVNFKAVII